MARKTLKVETMVEVAEMVVAGVQLNTKNWVKYTKKINKKISKFNESISYQQLMKIKLFIESVLVDKDIPKSLTISPKMKKIIIDILNGIPKKNILEELLKDENKKSLTSEKFSLEDKMNIYKLLKYKMDCTEKNIKFTVKDAVKKIEGYFDYQIAAQIFRRIGKYKNAHKIFEEVHLNYEEYAKQLLFGQAKNDSNENKIQDKIKELITPDKEKIFKISFKGDTTLMKIVEFFENQNNLEIISLEITEKPKKD